MFGVKFMWGFEYFRAGCQSDGWPNVPAVASFLKFPACPHAPVSSCKMLVRRTRILSLPVSPAKAMCSCLVYYSSPQQKPVCSCLVITHVPSKCLSARVSRRADGWPSVLVSRQSVVKRSVRRAFDHIGKELQVTRSCQTWAS